MAANNRENHQTQNGKTDLEKVAVLVYEGMELLDFAGPYEVLFTQGDYQLISVSEVFHFPHSSTTMFGSFINKLNLMKTLHSDLHFENDESFEKFKNELERQHDRKLTRQDFQPNPAKRQLAKLIMNR